MNIRLLTAWLCICIGIVSGCGKRDGAKPITGPPQAGALYSLNDGEGGFRVAKVIGLDEEVIFVRWYGDRWTERPSAEAARKATNAAFLAFSPETFSGMQPVHLENGTVAAEDSAEYEVWKQSGADPL